MKFLSHKNLFVTIISIVLISTNVLAQYYSGTEGLNGTSLKSVLYSKIDNHIRFPYTSSSRDVWDILKETDRDPNNSSNVLLLYTNYSVNAAQEYNSGSGWNREHVWASSHGIADNDTGYTDVHHLRPSDINANSTRGNKAFDYGGSSTYPTDNFYDIDSWEPRDEIKGDIARMMLYMTTRYSIFELLDQVSTSGSNFGKLSSLLEWNRLDPVSDFERNRNRVIYKYQKNFNPFVDHPEFADRIYNSDKLIMEHAEQVGNNLLLSFSKELNTSDAERLTNYQLDVLGNPTSVVPNFGGDSKKVSLSFAQNFVDTFYNIRVSNLTSLTGEKVFPNSIALFIGTETVQVDTVAPAAPTNFIASSTEDGDVINLNWEANTETDISHYAIYRGVLQNFTPGQYSLITTTANNSYSDTEIFDYRVYYKISTFDLSGNESDYSDEFSIIVGIKNDNTNPKQFSLSQNYPNPFNPSTVIKYEIGDMRLVSLIVYDVLGNEVATLVNETQSAGSYSIEFDSSSFKMGSGVYFYQLTSGRFISTNKMILVK